MEIRPECVPCLLKRVLFQSELVGNGREYESLSAAMGTFAELFGRGMNSAAVATEVHRSSYGALGSEDPYLNLKIRADAVAGEYLPLAEELVAASGDRFRAAVTLAVIGNIMDFGSDIAAIDCPEEFRGLFHHMLGQGIGSDDTELFRDAVKKAVTVIYVFDNCGESQLDKVLIREIRAAGARVIGVVRGAPILNDVSREDAVRIGLDRELDLMLDTGGFSIGLDLSMAGEELLREIAGADLLVAKGMANYEALSERDPGPPVVHLLRSKCVPVSESLGVPLDINVVRFRQ